MADKIWKEVEFVIRGSMKVDVNDVKPLHAYDGSVIGYSDAFGREYHPMICLEVEGGGEAVHVIHSDADLRKHSFEVVNYNETTFHGLEGEE
jgi:hypothetical protein